MSSVLANMNIHADENVAENVKKIGGGNVKGEMPKRAALGDLQNRVLTRGGIKEAEKNLKGAKIPNLRTVKARVDTRWKKDAQNENKATNNVNKMTGSIIAAAKPIPAAVSRPALEVAPHTISLRQGIAKKNGTVGTTTNCIQPQKEIKTVTTKMVENKLQQVQIETKLRSEDESIAKMKAILAQAAKGRTESSAAVDIESEREINVDIIDAKNEAIVIKIEEEENQVQAIVKVEEDEQKDSYSTAMIEEVRNIDEGDKESLILVSEYVNDIYEYLFQLEIENPIRKNHLSDQKAVTPKMRSVLLDWINEVHFQFHLVVETFHLTVGIIDRYLQKVKDTKRPHLQLVGITALFLAAKYEELYPPVMGDFIYMTDHSYNQQQILEMEIQMFRTLDCNLSRPVCIHFLRRFSKAADVEDFEHAMAKYFLELAAIEYALAWYKPSEIAAAALFLSLNMSKGDPEKATGFNDSYWDPTLEYYSHYNANHIRPITRKIAKIARNAPKAKLNAVYTKYQSWKLYKVSLRPELYSKLMDSLIGNDA